MSESRACRVQCREGHTPPKLSTARHAAANKYFCCAVDCGGCYVVGAIELIANQHRSTIKVRLLIFNFSIHARNSEKVLNNGIVVYLSTSQRRAAPSHPCS